VKAETYHAARVTQDGLLKRFKKDNAAGKYSLHVRLWRGDLTHR